MCAEGLRTCDLKRMMTQHADGIQAVVRFSFRLLPVEQLGGPRGQCGGPRSSNAHRTLGQGNNPSFSLDASSLGTDASWRDRDASLQPSENCATSEKKPWIATRGRCQGSRDMEWLRVFGVTAQWKKIGVSPRCLPEDAPAW